MYPYIPSLSLEFVVLVIVTIVIGVVILYFFGGKLWTFLAHMLSSIRTKDNRPNIDSTLPDREPKPSKIGKIGLAVVIANEYEGENRLVGTAKDKEFWEEAFEKLNFDVRTSLARGVGLNSTKKEMIRLIDLLHQIVIRERDLQHIAFVFSGHGCNGGILSHDNKWLDLEKDVFPCIFHPKLTTFNKLIFIDACRTSIDGVERKSLKISSEMISKSCDGRSSLDDARAFIAYATLKGRATADLRDGSNFSKCVTKWLQRDLTLSVVMDKATAEIHRMEADYYAIPERITSLRDEVNLYREALKATKSMYVWVCSITVH